MKRLRQYLRNGALDMGEVPIRAVGPGSMLVRSHDSCVRAGIVEAVGAEVEEPRLPVAIP